MNVRNIIGAIADVAIIASCAAICVKCITETKEVIDSTKKEEEKE